MLRLYVCNCSGRSGNWRRWPFTDPYLRLIAGADIQTAAAIMAAPKHGPHLYISHRGKTGKTTGYYVPHHAEAQIRQGVGAWSELQDRLRELAALNKERLIPAKAKK
jgi:hypothetical protein